MTAPAMTNPGGFEVWVDYDFITCSPVKVLDGVLEPGSEGCFTWSPQDEAKFGASFVLRGRGYRMLRATVAGYKEGFIDRTCTLGSLPLWLLGHVLEFRIRREHG
jgi:hypothetical protein